MIKKTAMVILLMTLTLSHSIYSQQPPELQELYKSYIKTTYDTSWALYDNGLYSDAISTITPLIEQYPYELGARYLRGISYYQIFDYDDCIEDLSFIIDVSPNYSNTRYWRGLAYYDNHQLENAEADFTAFIEHPTNDELKRDAYVFRGLTYFLNGKVLSGLNDFFINSEVYFILLTLFGIYLAGLLISSAAAFIILVNKKKTNEEKYQLYFRITSIINLPLLLIIIFLLSEFSIINPTIEILLLLLPDNMIISLLIIALTLSLILYGFVFFQRVLPSYFMQKTLRRVSVKLGRYVKLSSTFFFFIFFIEAAYMAHFIFMDTLALQGWLQKIVSFLAAGFLIYLIMKYYPHLIGFFYGKLKGRGKDMFETYKGFISGCGIKLKKIVVVKTSDLKMANAWVTGLFSYYVFFTDYLLDHFSEKEIQSVLAHELGHIKKGHLWINFTFILLWLFSSHIIETYITDNKFVLFGYTIFLILFLLLFIRRRLELQADRFVVDQTEEPEHYISALEKLAYLNTSPLSIRRLEEKFQTHPSIMKRIERVKNWINAKNS
jgi:Zn-dependent protease with chaperone function